MIDTVEHYIKVGVPLQAETKGKKILTSLQTFVTILFCRTKNQARRFARVILTINL